MTTPLLILIATVSVFALSAWVIKGRAHQRACPTCRVPYQVLSEAGEGPNTTYDVLACPQCANTATLVHGARNHLSYCPACTNRTLETPTVRRPGKQPIVEVREHCHLCGFEQTFEVRAPATRGRVIPFPTPEQRSGVNRGS